MDLLCVGEILSSLRLLWSGLVLHTLQLILSLQQEMRVIGLKTTKTYSWTLIYFLNTAIFSNSLLVKSPQGIFSTNTSQDNIITISSAVWLWLH